MADFDGDGKPDFCLFGAGRVALLHNAAELLDEVAARPGRTGATPPPGLTSMATASPTCCWRRPRDPKLLLNVGGQFRDVSAGLPSRATPTSPPAAWIDYDGDGKPDILLADGYRGLRLYRNKGVDLKTLPPVPGSHQACAARPSRGRRFRNSSKMCPITWGWAAKGIAADVAGRPPDRRRHERRRPPRLPVQRAAGACWS